MTDTTWFSLRRRLLWLLLGGVSACWLVTLLFSYFDAQHEVDELFDARLVQTAQALLAQRHDIGKGQAKRNHKGDDEDEDDEVREWERVVHPYQVQVPFQIWHRDGWLALRSSNAPTTPMTLADGFSDGVAQGGRWRYYSQWDRKGHQRVLVAESYTVRNELAGNIAWRLLTPALLGLPLLGFWVWISTRHGLAPLDAVADQISARQPDRLEPVRLTSAPEEIRPLLEAINSLFGRVHDTIESERRFTADAAHELRTPLAALTAQAQVAQRARDDAERNHAIEQLIAGSRRAARLVDQLLTLARLDPEASAAADTVSLDQLAGEVCAGHGGMAIMKSVALELDAAPATVPGDADMLRILLRNLVDNAIRYTPAGGRVTVAVASGSEGTSLVVTDTGPGIPVEERQQVFRRFHRLAGQETKGSGLGLSIVERIAHRHGATITLAAGENGTGLKVSLRFPPSAA